MAPTTGFSQSDARGKTIIVLDGSGSMWGEVPGGVKIDVAREAVIDLVKNLEPDLEIGLMAYGHRKKGDCEDIELMVAPGKGNRDEILRSVKSIVPKGKTPLCDAVIQAADYLKFEEGKATVILVSDGIETCGKDPCAVGDFLAAKGIDFKCHIVGFDLTEQEKKAIDCLAKKTGGLYFDAKDADGLRESLNAAVDTVVMAETSLILSARNSSGDLLAGVNFEIYADNSSEEPKAKGTGGKYRSTLDPGKYLVTATFGDDKAEGEVILPEGKTTNFELKFEATGLTAKALLAEGSEPIEKGLSWRIFRDPDGEDRRETVAYSYHAQPTFHLAPGKYFLQVRKEESTVEREVTIEDGKGQNVTVVIGSGILVAQAKMSADSPLLERGLSWKLLSPPDAEGDRKRVAYSFESKTHIIAPAGNYLLTVKHGDSYAQKEVELTAGETTEALLTFGAGILKATAVMSENGEVADSKLSWSLWSQPNEEGDRKKVSYSYSKEPEFKVPSGEYLLRLKRGSAEVEENVAVVPGEPTEVKLNLNAGTWTAEAFMAEGSAEPADKGLS
ncbi:MAG: VWA domain-containing protein, partial [Verrucomicrobiales bacterium]|nr:VWA domain-containing protein [Verrucomicrobiales bacterium]